MRQLRHALLAIATFALGALSACGGGGSDSAVISGVSTGGTGAYAAGPISGFGSVIVGGIEFDDRNASLLDDDGNPIARSDSELRLGMTVAIDGGALTAAAVSGGNASAVATTIRVNSEIVGRVSSVDAAAGTLTVLGQTVRTNAATVFDAASGGLLANLLDQVVEVFALPGATSGSMLATRVQLAPGAAGFKLRGIAASVDPAAKTLRVGGLTLAYGNASGTPASLTAGDVLRMRLLLKSSAVGVWSVTSFGAALPAPADGRDAEIEGLVGGYVAATARFRVNGVDVDASKLGSLPSGLADGARAEVSGRMSGTTLVASSVKIESEQQAEEREYEAKGSISAADPAAKTIVVRGVTINWSTAKFSAGNSALLTVGRAVEVHGVLAADRSTVRATEIDFPGL